VLDTHATIAAYVTSLQARRVPFHTQRAYAGDLRRFTPFAGDDLTTVTVSAIEAFLASGGVASATQRRRGATLRAFYHWLVRQDLVERNPMERIALGPTPELQPRPLSEATVKRILDAIPAAHTRDRALFTLLYETGMRVSEALGVQAADLDLTPDDEKIRVLGKRQRERTVLLTAAPQSIRLLRRHLKRSAIRSGSVFRGDQRYGGSNLPLEYSVAHYAWQKYCRLSAAKATIHQLRHSRATLLLKAGVPLATVRKILGHRNIQSTLIYAEVDEETVKADLLRAQRRQRTRA
jgi:site-specific recombinase XerD